MPYITSVEQIGYDRGVKEADDRLLERLLEAQRSIVLRLLSGKFGTIAPRLEEQIKGLPVEQLDMLADALLGFESVADLTTWLDS